MNRAEYAQDVIEDLPDAPTLKTIGHSLSRIDSLYNLKELAEEGIDVPDMLTKMTEADVIAEIESRDIELTILPDEIAALLAEQQQSGLFCIPSIASAYFFMRQMEETSNGSFVDVSAFNTEDFFLSSDFEFNMEAYAWKKDREYLRNLALLYSDSVEVKQGISLRQHHRNIQTGQTEFSPQNLPQHTEEQHQVPLPSIEG